MSQINDVFGVFLKNQYKSQEKIYLRILIIPLTFISLKNFSRNIKSAIFVT